MTYPLNSLSPPKPRILLLGANGQVGWELLRSLQLLGSVLTTVRQPVIWLPQAKTLDLSQAEAVRQLVREYKPDLIVNAAAYTAVDRAEQETEAAHLLNAVLPEVLASEAKRLDSLLVHYSTDYVFSGKAQKPYKETDKTAPVSVYGKTKLAGEQAIIQMAGRYLIFRTSWVYGLRGNNFFLTMLRLASERKEIRVVADQIGSPTWSRFIAEATLVALLKSQFLLNPESKLQGLFNLTCAGQTSWFHFAQKIIAGTGYPCKVQAITTVEYPTPAQRPAYSVLAGESLAQTLNISLPDWELGLQLCLAEWSAYRVGQSGSRG